MPFLSDFTYDVFVSYSLVNDELNLDGQPWVRRFVDLLAIKLKNMLPERGKDVAFYFAAKGDLQFGQRLASCREEAKRSAVFLIIGSPRYLDHWPTSELRAFTETGGADRIFIAELLPLPAGKTYPEIIGDPLRAPFWCATQRGSAQPLADARGEFDGRLNDFAAGLCSVLVAIGQSTRSQISATVGKATKSLVDGRAPPPRTRPVLLARVTDDLEPLNARLRTHLEQFDIEVLPADGFNEEGAAFRDEFREQAAHAPLVVQLLGQYPARRTRELPEGYDGFQSQEARAREGCRLVQWRDPALDLEAVADDRHRALLSGDVDAMGFEAFKEMIVRLATAPPPRPAAQRGGSFLFIDADRVDEETARRVLRACQERQIVAMMPEYDVDTPKDWRANYADCDRIAMIHEHSDRVWLNAQLKMFIRSAAKRRTPAECVIYLGPPPPKQASALTITHPSFVVVESPDGDLDRLIEQLT